MKKKPQVFRSKIVYLTKPINSEVNFVANRFPQSHLYLICLHTNHCGHFIIGAMDNDICLNLSDNNEEEDILISFKPAQSTFKIESIDPKIVESKSSKVQKLNQRPKLDHKTNKQQQQQPVLSNVKSLIKQKVQINKPSLTDSSMSESSLKDYDIEINDSQKKNSRKNESNNDDDDDIDNDSDDDDDKMIESADVERVVEKSNLNQLSDQQYNKEEIDESKSTIKKRHRPELVDDPSEFHVNPNHLSRNALKEPRKPVIFSDLIFTRTSFQSLGINPKIVEILQNKTSDGGMNLATATRIQSVSIPLLQKQQNVLLKSQTGSGNYIEYLYIEYIGIPLIFNYVFFFIFFYSLLLSLFTNIFLIYLYSHI